MALFLYACHFTGCYIQYTRFLKKILEGNLVSHSNLYNQVQTKPLNTPDQHQPVLLWKNTKLGALWYEKTVNLECDTAKQKE